jgi:hypothetical protein
LGKEGRFHFMRTVSSEIKIPREDFGPNPFLTPSGIKRAVAEEEAARDLAKHPRQLLADIHDESLDPRPEIVARTLARVASMHSISTLSSFAGGRRCIERRSRKMANQSPEPTPGLRPVVAHL